MQTCPNCESETRADAKFCTNCGYRFVGNGRPESQGGDTASTEGGPAWDSSQLAADDGVQQVGWPAAPASAEPGRGGWGPAPSIEPAPKADAFTSTTDTTGFWPEPASDDWPATIAQPVAASEQDAAAEPSSDAREDEGTQSGSERQDAQIRALDLLEQLRAVIVSAGRAGSSDLSGVIADLEVAATPPGAMPSDQLSELRDALFAARENPRDVDTIVDLTRRIDTLVALVIAYDRALAAIERSLAALRDASDGAAE